MKRTRVRMVKLFRVTRDERTQVTFYVEATSALKARRTPTPDFAVRQLRGTTVGEAREQVGGAQPETRSLVVTGDDVNTFELTAQVPKGVKLSVSIDRVESY